MNEAIEKMRYTLKVAAKTFGEYAEIHAAKTPPDEIKVRRNENLRDMCNEALGAAGECAEGTQADKALALQTILLLSALESWSFSSGTVLPDYLHDDLSSVINKHRKIILGESK